MKVCGYNYLFQLGEQSNNKNPNGSPIISPSCDSHIDVSTLLSFSTYFDNSIWVTQNGQAFAVGSNCFGQISILIPKKTHLEDKQIEIKGKNGQPCKFQSALCGEYYSLYLSADENFPEQPYLVYTYRYKTPVFLNLSGHIPKTLYGGKETAAVIDTDGNIIIITKSVLSSPKLSLEPSFLPENDKAVKLACCDEFVLALGSSGRVFEYSLINPGQRKFMEVNELQGQKFVDISGTFYHCFAVCQDGRVFGRGPNECCQLGLKKETKSVKKFTLINSLKKFKIVSSYAGTSHSLFVTINGSVVACGKNYYGECLLNSGPSRDYVYPPCETSIQKGASFCIAGVCTSIVFVDTEIPQNCPNRSISEFLKITTAKSSPSRKSRSSPNKSFNETENENIREYDASNDKNIKKSLNEFDNENIQKLEDEKDLNANENNQEIEIEIENEQENGIQNVSEQNINANENENEISSGLGSGRYRSENETLTEVFDDISSISKGGGANEDLTQIELENENLRRELEIAKRQIDFLRKKEKENRILKQELELVKREMKNLSHKE